MPRPPILLKSSATLSSVHPLRCCHKSRIANQLARAVSPRQNLSRVTVTNHQSRSCPPLCFHTLTNCFSRKPFVLITIRIARGVWGWERLLVFRPFSVASVSPWQIHSFHTIANSSASTKNSTPLQSSKSKLFRKNAGVGHPPVFLADSRGGGTSTYKLSSRPLFAKGLDRDMSFAGHELGVGDHASRVTSHGPRVTSHGSRITFFAKTIATSIASSRTSTTANTPEPQP
jgi:hypothetical protein